MSIFLEPKRFSRFIIATIVQELKLTLVESISCSTMFQVSKLRGKAISESINA